MQIAQNVAMNKPIITYLDLNITVLIVITILNRFSKVFT